MILWILLKPLGILSLILGLISLPTPLPIGAILLAFGTGLLVMTSPTARRIVRALRRRSGLVNGMIGRFEGRVGRPLGVALRRTRPLVKRLTAPALPPEA